MKTWMLLMLSTAFALGSVCPVQAEADDEYEEVVIRRKVKKTGKTPVADSTAETTDRIQAKKATSPQVVVTVTTSGSIDEPVVDDSALQPDAVAVVAPMAESVADKQPPPPPPEPPVADAAEPRRLVRYFCKAWKDKDYERMWWAMSSDYRKKISLKQFKKLFVSDAEMNGGLLDENILETNKTRKGNEGVKVELIFKFPNAQHRFATAEVERQTGGQFRMVESAFIPLDLEDL